MTGMLDSSHGAWPMGRGRGLVNFSTTVLSLPMLGLTSNTGREGPLG